MKKTYIPTEKIRFLPPSVLKPGSLLPRRRGGTSDDASLVRSIARYGILHPLLVREEKNGTVLLSGRRRLLAALTLGLDRVPCRTVTLGDREAAELVFAENLHRAPLDLFDEATAARSLQKAFPYRFGELADRIGVPASLLSAKLRLLNLSPAERRVFAESGLSPVYGESILHLRDSPLRLLAIRHISEKALSLEEAEIFCLSLALHPEEFAPPLKVPFTAKRRPVRRFVVKDAGFFVNSVDRVLSSIRNAGISVESVKTEEDGFISYSIRIPKGKTEK